MSNRWGGNSVGQAYIGTKARQPPNVTFNELRPTQYDRKDYSLSDFWFFPYTDTTTGTNVETAELWYLASLAGNSNSKGSLGKWVLLGGGFGSIVKIQTDIGLANPVNGLVNLFALPNAGGTVSFSVVPDGSNTINLKVSDVNDNTSIGQQAGYSYTTGSANTSLGFAALSDVTTGVSNTAVGSGTLPAVTIGNRNTAIGYESGLGISTGSQNTICGAFSGTAYTTESGNVLLGSIILGSPGDACVLRIGSGTGTNPAIGNLNTAIVAGIYQRPFSSTNGVVMVDSTNVLGSSLGTIGQLLQSTATGTDWATMSSAGGTVTITNTNGNIDFAVANPIPAGLSYQTGSFVPDITFGGTSGSTFANRGGNYTKIGNRVFFNLSMQLATKVGSGAARVTGLPFPATNTTVNNDVAMYLGITGALKLTAGSTWCWGTLFTSTPPNQLELREGNPTTGISDDLTDVNFTTGTEGFTIVGNYESSP